MARITSASSFSSLTASMQRVTHCDWDGVRDDGAKVRVVRQPRGAKHPWTWHVTAEGCTMPAPGKGYASGGADYKVDALKAADAASLWT